MSLRIDLDHARFKSIVRGKIRQGLKRYISNGELIGKQGGEIVSIPVPQIDIPRFLHSSGKAQGVGHGEGEPGDPLDESEGEGGAGKAGSAPGQHALEVDVSLEELADILGEELELPRIEPKGQSKIDERKDRYTGIRQTGPNSLRHFKRSFHQALRRQLAAGTYNTKRPIIIPIKDDMRFKSWKTSVTPRSNAVIIYMMDVSGSMGDEQKDIVRIESFWIDTWLKRQYKDVSTRFIVHDASAREVNREHFFRTKESGGTIISSAYRLANQIIEREFPINDWNIYLFHFSDGDNWGSDDTKVCMRLLSDKLLPAANAFCYGQVESPYGSGQFLKDISAHFGTDERVITSVIKDRDAIVDSIKDFLGKGR